MDAQEPTLWGCRKCATLGKTCCQVCEILVTAGDVHRIEAHTGRADFWSDAKPNDPRYLDQDDDPNWLRWVFRPDGTRPVLRRQENGDCAFLTSAGCSLPMEIRPLVCRLYPYAYTEAGINGVSDGCPPAVIPPRSTILKVLDMQLPDAVRWHRMLYSELQTGTPYDASRDNLRPAG